MTKRKTPSSKLHSKVKQPKANKVQVTNYSQEVRNALNEVLQKVKAVRKDEKINIKASTTPHHDNITDKDLNILNSFARILTGDEVCAAICNINGILVISTNGDSYKADKKVSATRYINTYVGLLQNYIKSPFKEDYQALEFEACQKLDQIRDQIREEETRTLQKAEEYYSKTMNSQNGDGPLSLECINLLKTPVSLKNLSNVIITGTNLIENYRYDSTGRSDQINRLTAVNILRPIIDTRIIAKALIDTSNKFIFDNVTKMIYQSSISILPYNIHSEMQILDAVVTQAKPGAYSIGISKLTCWPCEAIFQLFKTVPGQQITFYYTGTHAGTYGGWLKPEWLDKKYIKQFTKLLKEKAGQCGDKSKDDIPYMENSIPNEPILAIFESISEAQKKLDELRLEKQEYNTQQTVYETVKDKVVQTTEDIKTNQEKIQELSTPVSYLQKIAGYKEFLEIINLEVKDCTKIDETVKALSDEKRNEVKNKLLEKDNTYRNYLQDNKTLSLQDKIINMYDLYKTKNNLPTNAELSNQALKYEEQQNSRNNLEKENTELETNLKAQKGELSYQKDLLISKSNIMDAHKEEYKILNEAIIQLDSCYRLLRVSDTNLDMISLINEFSRKFSMEIHKSSQLKSVQNNIIDDKENAFNQKHVSEYLYQNHDILRIQKQLLNQYPEFIQCNPIQVGDDANNRKNHQELINNIENNDGPFLGVFNPTQGHWTAFCIIKNDDNTLTILYKDSLGSNADTFTKTISLLLSKCTIKEPIIFHDSIEQPSGSLDCGIFALQNMKIMAEQLSNNQGRQQFMEKFQEHTFCSLSEAKKLREGDFANLYREQVIKEESDVIIGRELARRVVEHHSNEEITDLLKQLDTKEDNVLQNISFQIIKSDEDSTSFLKQNSPNTIYIEIIPSVCIANSSYEYSYNLCFSNDLAGNEQIINALKGALNINEVRKLEGGYVRYQLNPAEINDLQSPDLLELDKIKDEIMRLLDDTTSGLYKDLQKQLSLAYVKENNILPSTQEITNSVSQENISVPQEIADLLFLYRNGYLQEGDCSPEICQLLGTLTETLNNSGYFTETLNNSNDILSYDHTT